MKLHKNKILTGILTCLVSASVFAQVPVKSPSASAPVQAPAATPAKPASAPVQAAATPPKVDYGPDYKGDLFDKIKTSGKIIIGYRASSIPMSFLDANKKPIGYGTEICLDIIDKLKQDLSMPNLVIEYAEVTSANRIPILLSGKIDMECASSVNNEERRQKVDFTVPYYVSGNRILTKNNSGIKSVADLKNKTVVVAAGTSANDLLKQFNKTRDMKIKITVAKDFSSSFSILESGKADAFVLLDFLLYGEASKSANSKDYSVVGDFLSVEPSAIMFRKNDPKFKSFIDKQMIQMVKSGKINDYYTKWFLSPIPPNNRNLNIPQSSLLKEVFRVPTSITGS